jgi:hypothetical protein
MIVIKWWLFNLHRTKSGLFQMSSLFWRGVPFQYELFIGGLFIGSFVSNFKWLFPHTGHGLFGQPQQNPISTSYSTPQSNGISSYCTSCYLKIKSDFAATIFCFVFCYVFKTESCYVSQIGLKLMLLLPLPPKCRDFRCEPLLPACSSFLIDYPIELTLDHISWSVMLWGALGDMGKVAIFDVFS